MKTLEDYLKQVFIADYHGIKDDFEDSFDSWLSEKDSNEIIEYAEIFIKSLNEKIEVLMKLTEEAINELKKIKELIK